LSAKAYTVRVTLTRLAFLLFVLTFASSSRLLAQSEGRFAVGGEMTVRVPPGTGSGDTANASKGPGLLWRFGHGKEGWGWHWGLGWYSTDVDRIVGASEVELGEIRIRPILAGYGYTHIIGRTTMSAKMLGGYALTKMALAPAASDAYRDRLGASAISVDSTNTFAAKPEVSAWFDVNEKIGINVSGGYMIARPNVTVRSTLGEDKRHLRADMFVFRIGAVYSVF
jgi:hypothetical protein